MKAKIRKLLTVVDEVYREMDRAVEPPTRRAVALAVIENPFRGEVSGRSLRTHGDWRGAWVGSSQRNVWQHSASKAARLKASARRRLSARRASLNMPRQSCIRKWERRCARFWSRGRLFIPSAKKDGRSRHGDRCAARPQGCGIRPLAFRCDRSACPRCAACQRNRRGDRGHGFGTTSCRALAACRNTRSRATTGCVSLRFRISHFNTGEDDELEAYWCRQPDERSGHS